VIRTLDPHVPNVVRYQTALHSVTSGASIDQPFLLHKHPTRKTCQFFDNEPWLLSPKDPAALVRRFRMEGHRRPGDLGGFRSR
jgi:hypothetical protein